MNIKTKIVLEYLEKWRNLPSLTLAKKIYAENKEVYSNAELIRKSIQHFRGVNGDASRRKLATLDFIDYNPFRLPQTDETEHFAYTFPSEANNVLCLFDIHVPYFNTAALTAALEYGQKNNVNAVFIGGDFLDCHAAASKYCPDPRKRNIVGEIEMGKQVLQIIRDAFPKAFIFYLKGNHEERLETYLMVKAPELFNLDIFKLSDLLDFKSLNIEAQTCSKQTVKMGSLNVIHGHELNGGIFTPVNIARGLFTRTKTSTLCGHHHQVSEHTESDLNGKMTTCFSAGTLGELHPQYLPNAHLKWSHGFAHVQFEGDEFKVRNYRILDGKIL